MTRYGDKPWLARYRPGTPEDITIPYGDVLSLFSASVAERPELPVVLYFDGELSLRRLDELSDAFACALRERGFAPGDRLACYLQNVPQVLVVLLGVWKAGGIVVPVNPMSRQRELRALLADSGASVLVSHRHLYTSVAADVLPDSEVNWVVSTDEHEFQSRNDERVLPAGEQPIPAGTEDLTAVLERFRGQRPPAVEADTDRAAFLTYTSGTTGPPKGAMNTHGNLVFNAEVYRVWMGLQPGEPILGVAPLFHITGIVGHMLLALRLPAPLVLTYRFEPEVVLDAIREHRPVFTVGSITAFIALMNAPGASREGLSSLTRLYSGGAPIPPSTVRAFQEQFGHYIHNIYGLTETTSPSHGVPLGSEAPVDPGSGALSVGVPVCSTAARVVDETGAEVPPGELGEIVIAGPQVVPGYWNKPEETARALAGGELRTGDVGYMDEQGWFYIVDRKKDQINTGGYKVWPREVEDALYEHPAVREAAVVGVPDAYRGEAVKAFVSLRPGLEAGTAELVAFCRERLSAYKCPRQVEILDELPKTATGKLLRRELRAREYENRSGPA